MLFFLFPFYLTFYFVNKQLENKELAKGNEKAKKGDAGITSEYSRLILIL